MKIKWLSTSSELKIEGGEFDGKVASFLMEQIAKEINTWQKGKVQKLNGKICLSSPVFRWASNGFHFLNLALYSEFEVVERATIKYLKARFYFTELALICLAMTPLSVIAFLLGMTKYGVVIFAAIWIGAFIGGIVTTSAWYSWWIDKKQLDYLRNTLYKDFIKDLG